MATQKYLKILNGIFKTYLNSVLSIYEIYKLTIYEIYKLIFFNGCILENPLQIKALNSKQMVNKKKNSKQMNEIKFCIILKKITPFMKIKISIHSPILFFTVLSITEQICYSLNLKTKKNHSFSFY